jgi:hypothetical protein
VLVNEEVLFKKHNPYVFLFWHLIFVDIVKKEFN